jgi:hypothetical protein
VGGSSRLQGLLDGAQRGDGPDGANLTVRVEGDVMRAWESLSRDGTAAMILADLSARREKAAG